MLLTFLIPLENTFFLKENAIQKHNVIHDNQILTTCKMVSDLRKPKEKEIL